MHIHHKCSFFVPLSLADPIILAEMSACAHRLGMALGWEAEREGERASLPLLLKTLQGVAADADALPGAAPAALQPLTALLAGASVLAMVTPPPRAGPAAHSFAAYGLRPRAATGPPGS